MNGKDLLTGMSHISTRYYEEAETTQIEEHPRNKLLVRPIVIAALITLMLLLMGCAWVMMNLDQLKLGNHSYTAPKHMDEEGNRIPETEQIMEVISLQGVAGSPEQMAAREWFEFEENYDKDLKLMDEADQNPIQIPRDYDAYFVYTQAMVDKVNEIAAKYGLALAGQFVGTNHWDTEIFFHALGLDNLHREAYPAEVRYSSGYFYACGNFKNEFYITLSEEARWEFEIPASMRYCRKGYLDTVFAYLREGESYHEHIYKQTDGEELLIVTGDDYAMMLCDTETAFVTVSFTTTHTDGEGTVYHMTEQDIHLVAEAMDFSVVPQMPDIEEAQRQLDESFAKWEAEQEALLANYDDPFAPQTSYAVKVQKVIDNGADPEYYYFALYDINRDGVEELFLSCEKDSFGPIYTLYNGQTYTLLSFGTDYGSYLCENDIVLARNPLNPCLYTFYSIGTVSGDATEVKIIDQIAFSTLDESWVRNIYGDTWGQELISEEEAMEIIASYSTVALEMKPISQFPTE